MTMKILNLKIILSVVCSVATINVFSQGTQWRLLGNNNVTAGTNFLGTTNAQPVDFRTNNTQRMRIDATTGFVGVGNNFTTPLNLVDVRDGNINIGQGIAGNVAASQQSYMIGGNNILWHKGEVRNLFVGVGS